MNFEHLEKNAQRAFEEAAKYAESKPDVSEKMKANGHILMVAYYLANENESYAKEVVNLINVETVRFSKHPEQAYTYLQNQYALLCLSIKEPNLAKKILSLPANYKNDAAFEIKVNVRLRQLIGQSQVVEPKTSKLTQTEATIIEAFDAALGASEIPWPNVASAWRAFKSKRYKLTVLEHRDLFTDALRWFVLE
jgi:hypothetical protein